MRTGQEEHRPFICEFASVLLTLVYFFHDFQSHAASLLAELALQL